MKKTACKLLMRWSNLKKMLVGKMFMNWSPAVFVKYIRFRGALKTVRFSTKIRPTLFKTFYEQKYL
jgi:hypothetical protein